MHLSKGSLPSLPWSSLPNALTLLRIALLPWLVVLFDSMFWRLLLLLFLIATDILDGWLARRFHLETRLGAILDPVADKLLVLAFLVAAFSRDLLLPWMFLALLLRDGGLLLMALAGLLWIAPSQRKPFQARKIGKAVTGLQFFCFFLLLVFPHPLWRSLLAGAFSPIVWPFALLFPLSLWALLDYFSYFFFSLSPPPET